MSKKAGKKAAVPEAHQADATQPAAANSLGTGLALGSSSKNKKYLKKIIDAIEGHDGHPRNMGIAMQAHHVISGDGMDVADIGAAVEATGYNINHLNNLAFIPCTLEGACYLGIQPHRGNHTAEGKPLRLGASEQEDQNDYYDDEAHSDGYHAKVAKALLAFVRKHTLDCTGDSKLNADKAIKGLDQVSATILNSIQDEPGSWPLTSISRNFGDSGKGCGGVKSVVNYDHHAVNCPVGRKHDFFDKNSRKTSPPKNYRLKFEKKKGILNDN